MRDRLFKGRRAAQIENDTLRVTILEEGGHIAEVYDKRAGISPLWIPHWGSLEPSRFGPEHFAEYGTGSDGKLLAGIMGHNLCLDIFGGPSREEAQAGLTVHGEASVDPYEISDSKDELVARLTLRLAQLTLSRTIRLDGENLRIEEEIVNLAGTDRPVGWTQHVTLSPPFLDPATTEFRASMTHSIVAEADPGFHAYLTPGRVFDWPIAPRPDGSYADLRKMNANAPASQYTAHVADAQREYAFFVAFSPKFRLAFGYVWKREDFPWLGIWEENCSRPHAPWNRRAVTRGMEFGVSPFPEPRREMVERNSLLDTPTYKWIPARGTLKAEYWILSRIADQVPEDLSGPAS